MATEVWAVSMVKDEVDIVEQSVGRMAREVDHVLVADNGSTDGTREILEALGVEVIDDNEPGYFQSDKMTALARNAGACGADWVIPFDADELWLSDHGAVTLAETLTALPPEALIAEATLFDHVATGKDDPAINPVARMQWRRAAPAPLRKVAVRPREDLTIHQGNHSASFSEDPSPLSANGHLQIRHFPYRSVEQFVSKVRNGAAAYAATDLPEEAGAHWRAYGRILAEQGEQGIADLFHRWFYRDDPRVPVTIEGEHQPALIWDPCPTS